MKRAGGVRRMRSLVGFGRGIVVVFMWVVRITNGGCVKELEGGWWSYIV